MSWSMRGDTGPAKCTLKMPSFRVLSWWVKIPSSPGWTRSFFFGVACDVFMWRGKSISILPNLAWLGHDGLWHGPSAYTWLRRHTWGSHFLNHLALRWIAWKSLWADVGVNVVSLHKACWVAIVHWVTLIVIIVILLALWTVVIGNNFKLLWLFSTCLSWLFCSSTIWVLLGHSQAIVCASLGYWLRTCSTMTGTEIDDFGIWLHHCIEWIHGEKLHHGRARLRVERRSTYVSPFLFTLGLWFCVGLWLLSGGFCSFLTRNQNFLHKYCRTSL